ncbi:MAG: DUF58 domain-containing protein [Candidatus Sumerlaeota bacterium]|nr:DUF58 domain-containing protein [Candidatus Sumerlaeota bacterium]
MALADILLPEDLQTIGNLEIVARQVVEGFCAGLHRSPHKGFSVEFRQHRSYVPGDEIRHIDWKVFGKSDRFYIREYEEETNLRATLLVDKSGSMAYGSGKITKFDYAVRTAACLAYLMLRQADGVGLVTFDDKMGEYIPSRSRAGHLRVLLDTLTACKPGKETELGKVFHELAPRLHRRGLLIVLSDCFGDVPELMSALAHFRHARHEIIIFQIWDRAELDFPFKQWTRFDSLEDVNIKRMVDPASLRRGYMENLNKFREDLRVGCYNNHIDLVPLVTDEPYAASLAHYLTMRKKY